MYYNFTKDTQSSLDKDDNLTRKYFLVCGLGNLGQHCVKVLEKFGVPIIAIDDNEKKDIVWEVEDISDSLKENLIVGDCRKPHILEQAKIKNCRAALLVTSDEQVNIEAAFVIKNINPEIRLVVSSYQNILNDKLEEKLENCVAYNINKLPIEAIATRALGDENRGIIHLLEERLIVFKDKIGSEHQWCNSYLGGLNTKNRIILSHIKAKGTVPTDFYQWEDNAIVRSGDEVAYIKVDEEFAGEGHSNKKQSRKSKKFPFKFKLGWNWKKLNQKVHALFESFRQSTSEQLSKRVIWFIFSSWLILLFLGFLFLNWINKTPIFGWNFNSLYSTFVMLLGGYQEVFIDISNQGDINIFMRIMNMLYMLLGLLFIGIVNAWLTQWWLNEKFDQLLANPYPKKDHIIIIGLGYQIGRPVATFLHEHFKQSVVAVSRPIQGSNIATQVQIVVDDSVNSHQIVGDLPNALSIVNIKTAKGIVLITDDERLNLEIGLMAAKEKNDNCTLIIRTLGTNFSDKIKTLFSADKVKFLCLNEIAARVFVATAFGKNVLNLLWINEQMVLVVEYVVKSNDTFKRRSLYEVISLYKIVPIAHTNNQGFTNLMPLKDIRLKVGDCLVFLATIESLTKIDKILKDG